MSFMASSTHIHVSVCCRNRRRKVAFAREIEDFGK